MVLLCKGSETMKPKAIEDIFLDPQRSANEM